MNTSVVLTIDTRTPKLDQTCPILLRIIHHDKAARIPTGISIKPEHWDFEKRVIKSSYRGTESVTRLNNYLQKKKTEATDIITKMDEQKTLDSYTAIELRDIIAKKNKGMSFYTYAEQLIEKLMEANRIGNALAYANIVRVLKVYQAGRPLTFQDITTKYLEEFETKHLAKGNGYGGLAVYMRTIRAIYNFAIKAGIVEKDLYPFSNYTIKTKKARKRAIRFDALKAIIALDLQPGHPLFNTRNYFLLSFFLRGMPFADLMYLKMSDIIDGRIEYDRRKTGKPYNVKITEEAQEILNYYMEGKEMTDFVFPVIKRKTDFDQYRDMAWERQRYNQRLKELGVLAGIQKPLTSYVARHTFATRAKNLGIDTATISEMLGHESIKTTEVYLDGLESDLLDDLHARIVKDNPKPDKGTNQELPSEAETGSAEAQPVKE